MLKCNTGKFSELSTQTLGTEVFTICRHFSDFGATLIHALFFLFKVLCDHQPPKLIQDYLDVTPRSNSLVKIINIFLYGYWFLVRKCFSEADCKSGGQVIVPWTCSFPVLEISMSNSGYQTSRVQETVFCDVTPRNRSQKSEFLSRSWHQTSRSAEIIILCAETCLSFFPPRI
jgi:hypothetical protein